MITLRGRRLLRFAPPLKQRCCRRRRRRGLLRSPDRVGPQRRSLHTRERARERSSSQVNESNRSATSFSSFSTPSHTLESESARPAPLPPPLNRLNIGAKMQERVCAGAAANRGGWIADDGLDGGRARRRIIKWIRGLEGRRPKNEGLPQNH